MADEGRERDRFGALFDLGCDGWRVKLHTVFITYNRLELTKRAIESYLETVSVPWTASVVDNGSTDGTKEWFFERFNDEPIGFTDLEENKYPGYATNLGWYFGIQRDPDRTHLHRADNDFGFVPGWCEEVERRFRRPKLGQLGLRTAIQEPDAPENVGGNCVIARELWDRGLRYNETPWPQLPPGITEDSFLTPAVERMGYSWMRVKKQCIYELQEVYADTNTDPYYERSWGDRHIHGRTPH